jgi:hypothetical protein
VTVANFDSEAEGGKPVGMWHEDFALAASPSSRHNIDMAVPDRFTFQILPDLLGVRRFRWTVREGEQIHLRSPHSYATRREAEIEGGKAVLRFAKAWPDHK